MTAPDPAWWTRAVVYQVYPRSFMDSDGDGMGDLGGVLRRLDHLADLGVDVLWLSPVYPSPQADNGYDISDYQDVDPMFGSLDQLDELVSALHDRGMKLLMDLVEANGCRMSGEEAGEILPEHDFTKEETREITTDLSTQGLIRIDRDTDTLILLTEGCR